MLKKDCSCLFTLFISTILGIIVGFFVYTTFFDGILLSIFIALGLAVGALILLFILATFSNGRRTEKCICNNGYCLAIGAIGTIITSIIAITIGIFSGTLGIAILIGLETLFLSLTILGFLNLLLCLIKTNCICK